MSKYHYIITAKKRLKEESKSNGTKTVIINEVTELKENGKEIYAPYSLKKGNKDSVFNWLMWFSILDFLFMIVLMVIGKDILNFEDKFSSLSSDLVAALGLLSMIFSFSKPREFIGKIFFRFGETGNKLLVTLMALILAYFISCILSTIGLTDRFPNLISIICVIVSFKNLQ